jgi:surface antigen
MPKTHAGHAMRGGVLCLALGQPTVVAVAENGVPVHFCNARTYFRLNAWDRSAYAQIERPMQKILRLIPLVAVLALAGCSMGSTSTKNLGPTLARPNPDYRAASLQQQPMEQTPIVTAARTSAGTGQGSTDVTAFVDPVVLAQLNERSRSEAAATQFNALQFGRPGAPRAWQGDAGVSGQVVVGPLVKVNSLDCRNFTHTVSAGGQSYPRSGTACRELDGRWTVSDAG